MDTNLNGHIEITPGVCGGRPRIAGHRIRVQDVAIWHEQTGMTADEIVSEYPGITLADVYAALAYYHDHRHEIARDIEEDEAFAETFKAQNPSRVLQPQMNADERG